MKERPFEDGSSDNLDSENLNLIQAFKKAVGLFGRVYDFPVIVQYESGRLDSIASAQLKDIIEYRFRLLF